MKKSAFDYLDEAIEKRALTEDRLKYYSDKVENAANGKDSKDKRTAKELKKSYYKSSIKSAVGVPAAVGGTALSAAMAPALKKDIKAGASITKNRKKAAGLAAGAAIAGVPMAVSGVKNLIKDKKEVKSRNSKIRNIMLDYAIEDMNEARKEREKRNK